MFSIAVDDYTLRCHTGPISEFCVDYAEHARLVDQFDRDEIDGVPCFFAVARGNNWPFLVVTQRSRQEVLFKPSALIVPETERLFLGIDERLVAYDLSEPRRLWEDSTDCGVLGWAKHGQYVLMSAELELAAWDDHGQKQWSTFVEPPWTYSVSENEVRLDVMGNQSAFPMGSGPRK